MKLRVESKRAHVALLHLVVFIFGFTAILGKLIETPSDQLVLWRMLIAAAGIAAFGYLSGIIRKSLWLNAHRYALVGLVIAAHWITFFEAVKVSNVSVTLACMSAATLFTALIEPLAFKRRLHLGELLLGLAVIFGLGLIFSFESQYALGIAYALSSAFLAALFNVLNGTFIRHDNPIRISLVEMISGSLAILLWLAFRGKLGTELFSMPAMDWVWIALLGTLCTAFAFVASVRVMRVLTPFTVSLSINLEPVYGILLALLIFGESEKMSGGFYAGTAVLLAAIFVNARMRAN